MQKHRILLSILLTLLIGSLAGAQATTAPAPGARRGGARGGPVPSATQPAPKNQALHQQYVEIAKKGDIDLLFLGDSITDFWHTRGKAVWDNTFAPLKAANFGINADRTQHLLYRLQNGELEGFKAKCIVLMIGTNNIGSPEDPRNTTEDAIAGIKVCVNEIRTRQPQAKLLLLAIFPRGETTADGHRPGIKQANAELAKWDDGKNIFFMDIGDKFMQPDGSISKDIMVDYLHPSDKGYQIWADAIIGKVKELMAMK